ncbi:hypothetical protein Acor_70960 [Acrocarpospora corrugata]|uniref:Uncharacterized protein n=1 Tax=Acrocarpospora corrugata TaxID=35763 RepID=A0A5M3WF70_9ACTN|nr:hypothetical protein [Acrocarpospora corrugata]GES05028.1 hypothetical protein Acor_70960 [Acrocarpospora corrugata]
MVIVDVVLETYDAVGFTAWPIAEPSADRLLALSGQMSWAEIGTAMAVIFSYNHISAEPAADLTQAHLDDHLAEAEVLIAPGGLRFRDTATNIQVAPGCCFGLENWRDWWEVTRGQEPWLGHDPETRIEHRAQTVQLRQNDQDGSQVRAIEITISELPRLLVAAHQQLNGFLNLVQRWAADITPGLAVGLVAALDEHLKVTGSPGPAQS